MDYDGDGVKNSRDVCPYNKLISKTNFQDYFIVKLDPEGTSQSGSLMIRFGRKKLLLSNLL